MENETIAHDFSIKEVEYCVRKLMDEFKSIPGFEYEAILKEKALKFAEGFAKKSSESFQSHSKEPYNLELIFKTESKLEELIQSEKQQENQTKSIKTALSPPNIFLYSFSLPCGYESYEEMVRDCKIQTKLDDMISSYEIKEEIFKSEELKVEIVELSYKRVLIISPREFVYLRVFLKEKEENSNQSSKIHWMITFSIPYEKKTDKTTAEIILTVQRIEENIEKNKINIKVYSEVDMKTAVKPDMAKNKGFAEIKKYVQKLYDYSKTMK